MPVYDIEGPELGWERRNLLSAAAWIFRGKSFDATETP